MPKKKTKSSIPRKYRKEEPIYRPEAPKKITSKLYHFDKRYYFNLKAHRWKRHIDGDWDNGPIIFKVPLSPEQAVLSCCIAGVSGTATMIRFTQSAALQFFCNQNCPGEKGPVPPAICVRDFDDKASCSAFGVPDGKSNDPDTTSS